MTDAQPLPGPLVGLRILELADEKGQFCGKLMGDLGADVIKIDKTTPLIVFDGPNKRLPSTNLYPPSSCQAIRLPMAFFATIGVPFAIARRNKSCKSSWACIVGTTPRRQPRSKRCSVISGRQLNLTSTAEIPVPTEVYPASD